MVTDQAYHLLEIIVVILTSPAWLVPLAIAMLCGAAAFGLNVHGGRYLGLALAAAFLAIAALGAHAVLP